MPNFQILTLPNFQYFPYDHLPFDVSADVRCVKGPLTKRLTSKSLAHWKEWLGTLTWEDINHCKAYLFVMCDSNSNALSDAYRAVMISAPLRPVKGRAILISGVGRLDNEALDVDEISSTRVFPEWLESHYMRSERYHDELGAKLRAADLLEQWKGVFQKLTAFQKQPLGEGAVALSIESLRFGLQAEWADFRIPLFVRGSEGIMATKKRGTKEQFVDRGEKLLTQYASPLSFVSDLARLRELLKDLFDIRSGCVHGMPFGWKLKKRQKWELLKDDYEYLAEECCRRAIHFALSNEELLSVSADRDGLEDWCEKNWLEK
jgi:hypothetical protein